MKSQLKSRSKRKINHWRYGLNLCGLNLRFTRSNPQHLAPQPLANPSEYNDQPSQSHHCLQRLEWSEKTVGQIGRLPQLALLRPETGFLALCNQCLSSKMPGARS